MPAAVDHAPSAWFASIVLATDYSPDTHGPELSTWIFLGSLALGVWVVLAVLRWSISGYHPPEPREDLMAADLFWDVREGVRQIDLGRGWRSTDDPYAMWHLWSLPTRRELVGLRMGAMPHPSAMGFAGGRRGGGRAEIELTLEEDGRQVPWEAGPDHRLAMTGMHVLAADFDCPHHDVWGELRPLPDGIDQLCGGTGRDTSIS